MNSNWNGIVTVDNKEYRIEWIHDRFYDRKDMEVLQLPYHARTVCYLSYASDYNEHIRAWTSCGTGCASCSWFDNFCRKTGRKISLGRALLDSGMTQDQRRQVWQQVLTIKDLV
jgi:hypothetical protein